MFRHIRGDIAAIRERDPAARHPFEIFVLYSGLHAIIWHRPAHWLYTKRCFFLARLLSQLARFFTGVEIHPGAQIGHGVLIDHGSGVVIGETAVVGDGCTIYQGVTLGGTGKDQGKRHPTLGKNVIVGSGAKILGPFSIGDNCKVASNAVVLQPLPPGSTAVGVPAKVVRINGKKITAPLDHIHMPDPVSQELCRLAADLNRMENRMRQLEQALTQTENHMPITRLPDPAGQHNITNKETEPYEAV